MRRPVDARVALSTLPDYRQNDLPTNIADLLANLMHLCDDENLDLHELFDRAWRYYEEELEEAAEVAS